MKCDLSCGVCAACRPKYQRHVDSIYPQDVTQGIVRSNLQKLTFYALTKPEKLDKIGAYLSKRIGNDIYRQRRAQVLVGCEAMDQLLTACHSSASLHLFVESFLKIVQKLLETNDAGLEVRATQSFESFSTKQEETPGYHRRYDFFISKFSSMCHNNNSNLAMRDRLRVAGLKGLRGVIRKSVGDDLQANIWEKQHMDKIVPSILYNLHDKYATQEDEDEVSTAVRDGRDAESPRALADTALRDLVGKASFGNMKTLLRPIVKHCDNHNLWTQQPPEHAIDIFSAVMYSVQNQYLTVVIKHLIEHLDEHTQARVDVRVGISTVLAHIIGIAAVSIGPAMLEIFNSLLRHLRKSVSQQQIGPQHYNILNRMVICHLRAFVALTFGQRSQMHLTGSAQPLPVQSLSLFQTMRLDAVDSTTPAKTDERRFQDTLIKTIGDFAYALPNYQKFEVMMFVLGKIHDEPSKHSARPADCDRYLQHVLVRTLLHVATKYETKLLGQTFTTTFSDSLMKLSLVDDNRVRLSVQQILHTLLDRHDNTTALSTILIDGPTLNALDVTVEKCDRADLVFWRQHSQQWLCMLYYGCTHAYENNTKRTYDALLCTLLLLFVELGCADEVLLDLLRLLLSVQAVAQELYSTHGLNIVHRARLHAFVARAMHVIRQLIDCKQLNECISNVIDTRIASNNALIDPTSSLLNSSAHCVSPKSPVDEDVGDAVDTGHVSVRLVPSTAPTEPDDVTDQYTLNHLTAEQQLDEEALTLPEELLFESEDLQNALASARPNLDVSRLSQPFNAATPEHLSVLTRAAQGLNDALSVSTAGAQSADSLSPTSRSRRNTILPAGDESDAVVQRADFNTDFVDLPLREGSMRQKRTMQQLRERLAQEMDEKWLAQQEAAETKRIHDLFTTRTFDELIDYQEKNRTDSVATIERIRQRAQERRARMPNRAAFDASTGIDPCHLGCIQLTNSVQS